MLAAGQQGSRAAGQQVQEGAQQCSPTEQPRSADGRMRRFKAEVFGKYLYEEQYTNSL